MKGLTCLPVSPHHADPDHPALGIWASLSVLNTFKHVLASDFLHLLFSQSGAPFLWAYTNHVSSLPCDCYLNVTVSLKLSITILFNSSYPMVRMSCPNHPQPALFFCHLVFYCSLWHIMCFISLSASLGR